MAWVAVVLVAFVLGWLGTRLVRDAAPRLRLMDEPDGKRKLQARAVPVGGGLAILVATAAGAFLAGYLDPDVSAVFASNQERCVCLLLAAVLIAAVGLFDDAYELRARFKLLGQFAAIGLLIGPGGFLIEHISILGWEGGLGLLSYPVTALWFLAAINALNLLDGMDGLLGTVGVIVCGALAAMAEVTGQALAGAVALALAGALAGFLRYNLPPASIYMGDCGSMLVGLLVAAVAIESSLKSQAVALLTPSALLVLPFLDTTAAIVRRQLSGRGWAMADRGHLHHVLQQGGLTVRRSLLVVAALGIIAAAGALVGLRYRNDMISVITAAGVVLMLLTSGLFGRAEMLLIRQRAAAAVAAARGSQHTVVEVRVPAPADWPTIWHAVVEAAPRLRLNSLLIETADGREPFRQRWSTAHPAESAEVWKAELAMRDRGKPTGRLLVTGLWGAEPVAAQLAALSELVERNAGPDLGLTPAPRPAVVS
jgi:UDP-GlcNAc:undecaprenyl-phosphate/decaprenyl-phosphate GlcNAc-1-phosphate transferase